MRKRVTLGVVTGALALSGLAVPAAQADGDAHRQKDVAKTVEAVRAASDAADGKSAFRAAAEPGVPFDLDLKFSGVKVNNGKPIVAGPTKQVTVPVTYKITHAKSVDIKADDFIIDVELYRGQDGYLFGDYLPTCTPTSSTTANCKGQIDIYPDLELINSDAGTWTAAGYAVALNGEDPLSENPDWSKIGVVEQDKLTTAKLQRAPKLTVNASPEPVKKGKTITVTGKLTRANWETGTYTAYSSQSVKLQFRTKSATSYTTIKTIKSNSKGDLKTTVTASKDGYYRYSFAGTTTSPAVSAPGDFIDVK
ncbi:hypothetical protein ACFXAZ_07550 [Streptomyces sp. NPDC059477]|uniref:hypothetical protein n=1 Tax=Streptomyces sp. NPDC059477 TaxID=3346847 RepID=UPI0036CE5C03